MVGGGKQSIALFAQTKVIFIFHIKKGQARAFFSLGCGKPLKVAVPDAAISRFENAQPRWVANPLSRRFIQQAKKLVGSLLNIALGGANVKGQQGGIFKFGQALFAFNRLNPRRAGKAQRTK